MSNINFVITLLITIISLLFSFDALASTRPTTQPTEGIACLYCSLEEAKVYAEGLAPSNNCRPGSSRGRGGQCPTESRYVLVPDVSNGKFFKFRVTTSVDSRGFERVGSALESPTAEDYNSMDVFFQKYQRIKEALRDAEEALQREIESQSYKDGKITTLDRFKLSDSSANKACENSFADILTEEGSDKYDQMVRGQLIVAFDGKKFSDISRERVFSGGSISTGGSSVGFGVSLTVVQKTGFVFEMMYDAYNTLSFDVAVDEKHNGGIAFDFYLNKSRSWIEGYRLNRFTSSTNVDLTHARVSACLEAIVKELGDTREAPPPPIGGEGTWKNPYQFDDGSFEPFSFCTYTTEYRTCYTDPITHQRICNTGVIKTIAACK